jgi:hypothetical protein
MRPDTVRSLQDAKDLVVYGMAMVGLGYNPVMKAVEYVDGGGLPVLSGANAYAWDFLHEQAVRGGFISDMVDHLLMLVRASYSLD